jgi:hypothetical protein
LQWFLSRKRFVYFVAKCRHHQCYSPTWFLNQSIGSSKWSWFNWMW